MVVGEFLKLADKLILEHDFDGAEHEVNKALQLDPGNIYALAYLERVKHFRHHHPAQGAEAPAKAGEPTAAPPKPPAAAKGSKTGPKIIVVDDENDYRSMLELLLSGAGYNITSAASPEEAMKSLATLTPDLILCDINFENSKLDGFSVFEHVRKIPRLVAVPFIFITGLKDERIHTSSLEIGVDDFIAKPFSGKTLLAALEGKLKRYKELKNINTPKR